MAQARVIANRYELEDRLGAGGMGVVYRARDRSTGDAVAVKVLRPEAIAADPTILERFRRESEALRRLNHPSIVKILDSFEENNRHFIIMEYVGGGSLAEELASGKPMPIPQVLEIALDLADALTRAHRLKIIHRDLKPQNVLLAQDGTPRLTDFGVAQIQEQSRVTQTGMIIGTVSYLSPEACDGAEYDERSDIWAFGVMLYEMIAGRRPFDEATTSGTLVSILSKPTPPLSNFRPETPLPLVDLIERMLQKSPEDRLPSVRLIGAEIETIIRSLDDSIVEESIVLKRAMTESDSRFDMESGEIPIFQLDFAQQEVAPVPAAAPLPASEPTPLRRDAAPRLFISYRREDSAADAEKIAVQLGKTFGAQNILKDIDRLMLRTVSRLVLAKDTVGTSSALIVVIGKKWLKDIGDPKDSVRQELEVGLAKPGMVIVPVLVGGATLPTKAQLPPSLAALADQTPQRINDASFDADAKRLAERLGRQFGVKTGLRFPYPAVAIVAVVVAVVALLALLGAARRASIQAVEVEPVAAGELMVLVAPLKGGDAAGGIVTTLNQQVRIWLPASALRVRDYPNVIESADEARAAAELNKAAVVVWGDQTEDGITVNIQAGANAALPFNTFDHNLLERTANLTVRLSDPRSESLLPPLLSVLGTLYAADGDGYEVLRHLILTGALEVSSAQLADASSMGAYLYTFYRAYLTDTAAALQTLEAAAAAQPDNPIVQAYLGLIHQRLNQREAARGEINRAAELGPENWTVPLYLAAVDTLVDRDVPATIDTYSRIVALRPGDWFPLNYRGSLYYVNGTYDLAQADFERVIELEPDANFPYAFLSMIALRDGRIADARALINSIRPDAADPVFARLVEAGGSGSELGFAIFSTVFNIFVHQLQGDYEAVIRETETALAVAPGLTDLYLLRGLAQCSVGDYAAAEATYSLGIDLDTEFTVLHLLRAQARVEQGRRFPLLRDLAELRDATDEERALAAQMRDGVVDCANLFQPGV